MPPEDEPTGYSKRSIRIGSARVKPAGHFMPDGYFTGRQHCIALDHDPVPAAWKGDVERHDSGFAVDGHGGFAADVLSSQPHHIFEPHLAPWALALATEVASGKPWIIRKFGGNGSTTVDGE